MSVHELIKEASTPEVRERLINLLWRKGYAVVVEPASFDRASYRVSVSRHQTAKEREGSVVPWRRVRLGNIPSYHTIAEAQWRGIDIALAAFEELGMVDAWHPTEGEMKKHIQAKVEQELKRIEADRIDQVAPERK